jgi:hypothetical protein
MIDWRPALACALIAISYILCHARWCQLFLMVFIVIPLMIVRMGWPTKMAIRLFIWEVKIRAYVAQLIVKYILKYRRGKPGSYVVVRQPSVLHCTNQSAASLDIIGNAPRPGDSSVSSEWLSHILGRNGRLSASQQVVSVEAKGLDGNRGMVGAMTRLYVTYQKPTPVAAASDKEKNGDTFNIDPPQLILKMTRYGYKGRQACMIHGVREAW